MPCSRCAGVSHWAIRYTCPIPTAPPPKSMGGPCGCFNLILTALYRLMTSHHHGYKPAAPTPLAYLSRCRTAVCWLRPEAQPLHDLGGFVLVQRGGTWMQSQPAGVQAGHRASLPGQHHAHAHELKDTQWPCQQARPQGAARWGTACPARNKQACLVVRLA